MNTVMLDKEITLDKVYASAKKISVPKQTQKPLPCEKKNINAIYQPFYELTKEFPVLDLSFAKSLYFDERYNCYLPLFAIFSVEETGVSIDQTHRWNDGNPTYSNPNNRLNIGFNQSKTGFIVRKKKGLFSRKVKEYYKPFEGGYTINYRYDFEGQIPDQTREIYYKNHQKFDDVALICEAKNQWKLERKDIPEPKPIVYNYDPIMVGVKYVDGNPFLFVLDKFNLTAAESYLLKEF